MKKLRKLLIIIFAFGLSEKAFSQSSSPSLFDLNTGLKTRSISFENPTGEPGSGGKAASNLGPGRKGAPNKQVMPGEEVVLMDIKGSGTIRHIWMGGSFIELDWMERTEGRKKMLRSTIIRAFWDGQEHPSIECPLGDFMGLAHSKVTSYQSVAHSVGENGALNFWLPMPFAESARITITNDSDLEISFYYQIDYTIDDKHPEDFGRLHACFRRENPTTLEQDFTILPQRNGKGRFIGALIGVRTLHPEWWGEGEIKFYLDGDQEYPTLCGTGSEDYVGLSYGIQQTPFLYHGANLNFISDTVMTVTDIRTNESTEFKPEYISMYRWHVPDPVYWERDCRVTIQQIGCCYYERSDDWSAAAFWYEPIPSAPVPAIPSRETRIANLDLVLKSK